nr:putative reverse transcriptase domain-containing protein [Tanacetum cinerariifolium]
MIDQGVTVSLAVRDALRSTNGDDRHNSGTGVRRTERAARECTYTDFLKCQPLPFKGPEGTVGHEATYGMSWKTLMKMMTDKYCPRNKIRKLEMELWELKVKASGEKKQYGDLDPYALNEIITTTVDVLLGQKLRCYECGVQGHFRREYPKLKNNNNHGNQGGRNNAPARVYAVGRAGTDLDANVVTGRAGTDPDDNVVTGTFLLNNRYASILFDTGADRSFVSTTFSTQINITPSTLDHCYDVELADGRIIGLNTILRGSTLNLLNHPFDIDLMPVELGSFDSIIGMDWLAKYQAVIVCAEKIIRVPWGDETLIIPGDGCCGLGHPQGQGRPLIWYSFKSRLQCHELRARARITEARFKDENNQAVDTNIGNTGVKDKQEVKKADDQEIENIKDEEGKIVEDQHVSKADDDTNNDDFGCSLPPHKGVDLTVEEVVFENIKSDLKKDEDEQGKKEE